MQNKVSIAETAIALLRQTLAKRPTVYGDEARQVATSVREQVRLVEHAMEAVRPEMSYNTRARSVVGAAGVVLRQAETMLVQLQERTAYTGPLRSRMTVKEKSAYIRAHGSEAYLNLPE
jgi:hypothetical protein